LYGTKGKLKIDTMDEFAYILIAPMIFYFAVLLLQEISLFSCDYVLYPSRDAYLIKKICDKIREKQSFEKFPRGEYRDPFSPPAVFPNTPPGGGGK